MSKAVEDVEIEDVKIEKGISVAERRHFAMGRESALVKTLKRLSVGGLFLIERLPSGCPTSIFTRRGWGNILGIKVWIRLLVEGTRREWRVE